MLNFAFCGPASKERLQLKRIGYISLFMTLTRNVIKYWVAPRYTLFTLLPLLALFSLFKQLLSKRAIQHIHMIWPYRFMWAAGQKVE